MADETEGRPPRRRGVELLDPSDGEQVLELRPRRSMHRTTAKTPATSPPGPTTIATRGTG